MWVSTDPIHIKTMIENAAALSKPYTANVTPFPFPHSKLSQTSPLRSWLLLLLFPQRRQTNTRDLDDLESHTRNISLRLALTTKTSEQNLVVLVYEVETTIIRYCMNPLASIPTPLSYLHVHPNCSYFFQCLLKVFKHTESSNLLSILN